MLDDIAGRIVLIEGWRRWAIALVAGALASLALPPVGALPLLAVALPVLVWLIDGAEGVTRTARARSTFAVGWFFGLGWFGASLYWITEAFLVEAETFGWMAPLAVPLLAGGLALFHGLGTVLARAVWSDGWTRVAALAFGLGAMEWARGHALTGFPWNVPGMALAAHDAPAQGASLVGQHGLTVLALLVFASPAALALGRAGRARWIVPLVALVALAGLWGWGTWRMGAPEVGAAGLRGVAEAPLIRIVQPAIPQVDKFVPENAGPILERYLEISRTGPRDTETPRPLSQVDALVWPESAFPFVLAEAPQALARITDLAAEGPVLLTGALRVERDTGAAPRAYNSLYAIGARGILAAYDKTHLVPFGEYLPWQGALEAVGLEQLTRLRGGFTAGTSRTAMEIAGLPPFQPLICYEAIFTGEVLGNDRSNDRDKALGEGARPAWLLNVTNDAWFGASLGPAQHLAHARLRAIEEGLPLVRAANTGISVVLDAYGRTRARLELGTAGALDARLPVALSPPPFARWGWRAPLAILGLAGIVALMGRTRRR